MIDLLQIIKKSEMRKSNFFRSRTNPGSIHTLITNIISHFRTRKNLRIIAASQFYKKNEN